MLFSGMAAKNMEIVALQDVGFVSSAGNSLVLIIPYYSLLKSLRNVRLAADRQGFRNYYTYLPNKFRTELEQ
jgi:hypothetical protein